MKNWGLILSCLIGVSLVASANEPAEKGPLPTPPLRHGRGEMLEGGEMLLRPAVVKQLALSNEQQLQIAAVVGSASNEMSALRAKVQSLARKQAELMGAEPIDEAAILKLSDEIDATRSGMSRTQVKQLLAARKILTADQRLKMREMMKRFLEKQDGKGAGPNKPRGENKARETEKRD